MSYLKSHLHFDCLSQTSISRHVLSQVSCVLLSLYSPLPFFACKLYLLRILLISPISFFQMSSPLLTPIAVFSSCFFQDVLSDLHLLLGFLENLCFQELSYSPDLKSIFCFFEQRFPLGVFSLVACHSFCWFL